jgi:hypothetical protein
VTAFYVLGGALAAWAVILTALGLSNPEFPGRFERAVEALSLLLVVATISAAIIGAAGEEEEEAGHEESAALVR